jgi:hypothetical protein
MAAKTAVIAAAVGDSILPYAGLNLIGCGGGGANNTGTSTPTSSATTYSLTLTGTDSVNRSIVASTTFTLTVH